MGNSGSKYTPPPATPMPIEDDIKARHEAAGLLAEKSAGASRSANDLGGKDANKDEAMTRSKLGMADRLEPQPAARGPRGPRPSAGTVSQTINQSAVLTG